jgi:ATP-dependent HslUV protease subunit HslV
VTTIAYCDGVLAADTQMTCSDGSRWRVTKLERLPDGSIVGFSGDSKLIPRLVRWISRGMTARNRPRFKDDDVAEVLLVKPDGTVWLVDTSLVPERITSAQAAIGSGGPYAMGAMACGRDAEAAVNIACLFDSSSSPPVETMSIEKERA